MCGTNAVTVLLLIDLAEDRQAGPLVSFDVDQTTL